MKKNMWLKRFSLESLKSQFIEIIDLLNKREVPYFVDCGALLGIVRDGDLLPWDNDTDLAVNAEDEAKLTAVVDEIRSLGWHCKFSKKYGDWSVTVKNWSCKGELTIFGAETKVKGPIIVDQSNKT